MGSFRRDFGAALVSSGTARWLSPAECRAIEATLTSQLPWSGPHVAWQKLAGSRRFEWGSRSDAHASSFVRELALYQHAEVTLLYSQTDGLRVASFWLAGHPDVASCNAQQYFGIGGTSAEPDLTAVAEFDTGRTIWGLLPNPPLQRT